MSALCIMQLWSANGSPLWSGIEGEDIEMTWIRANSPN
jgi:hypothetical protein